MNILVMFSGGKDSAALCILMKKAFKMCKFIFCNTGWELPETLEYIDRFNRMYLENKLITLKSKEYDGMLDLIHKKNYMPTVHQRFCTEELKVKPIQDYIKTLKGSVHCYNGVRREESLARRQVPEDTYDSVLNCHIHRPLVNWTAERVFLYLKAKKIIINPLYEKGMKRIGCGPCIMISLKELAVLKETHPERIDEIRRLEKDTGQFFFKSNYVPEKFKNQVSSTGNARASIDDVIKYLDSKEKYHEISEVAGTSCMSYYNLCE